MNKWIATLMAAVLATASWAWPPRQNYAWQTSWREDFRAITLPNLAPGIRLKLPPGRVYHELTVTAWMRWDNTQYKTYGVPSVFWTPNNQRMKSHDILSGAGHYGNPVPYDFADGPLDVPGATFVPYTNVPPTINAIQWPYGVYCVVGEAENPMTIVAGGVTLVVSNRFNRNFVPTEGTGVSVTGTGLMRVGIGHARMTQYMAQNISHGNSENILKFDEMVTNEYAFVTWRLRADGGIHQSTLTQGDSTHWTNKVSALNAWPANELHTNGLYELGFLLLGSGKMDPVPSDYGRIRSAPKWASDEELEREWQRGVNGINKRSIDLWR